MRALWIVAALIGIAILIFAHATVIGIVVGIAFLGTGCLLVPKAARSQDRSQSQVVSCATRFLGVLATVTRVRPRGERVLERAMHKRLERRLPERLDAPRPLLLAPSCSTS
jgi:hypothetical protein